MMEKDIVVIPACRESFFRRISGQARMTRIHFPGKIRKRLLEVA